MKRLLTVLLCVAFSAIGFADSYQGSFDLGVIAGKEYVVDYNLQMSVYKDWDNLYWVYAYDIDIHGKYRKEELPSIELFSMLGPRGWERSSHLTVLVRGYKGTHKNPYNGLCTLYVYDPSPTENPFIFHQVRFFENTDEKYWLIPLTRERQELREADPPDVIDRSLLNDIFPHVRSIHYHVVSHYLSMLRLSQHGTRRSDEELRERLRRYVEGVLRYAPEEYVLDSSIIAK